MRKRTPRYAEPLDDDQTPRRRTVSIKGKTRAVRVEPLVWSSLAEIAADTDTTVDDLCGRIDALRGEQPLASAIRLFVLHFFRLAARVNADGDVSDDDDAVFDDGLPPSFDLPPFAPLDAEGGFHARTDGFAEPRTTSRLERRQAVDRALEILFRD